MNKVLAQFKMNKVQMNKLSGGYSAICDLVDKNGVHYPTEIRYTNIAEKNRLIAFVADSNKDMKVLDCVYD